MSLKGTAVHPIVRQIIDRDCHVSLTNREVLRHVISKLNDGYVTFRTMSKAERRKLIRQCISHHRSNFLLYAQVMGGSTRRNVSATRSKVPSDKLAGREVVRLMRKHRVTIPGLAFRLGTTKKRVRSVRQIGLTNSLAVRDWIEAISGDDPGPLPECYRIRHHTEESACGFCGCPLYVGDNAFEYVGEVFCSTYCCRKSRGWS